MKDIPMIDKGPRRGIQHKILPRSFWAASPRDKFSFVVKGEGGKEQIQKDLRDCNMHSK